MSAKKTKEVVKSEDYTHKLILEDKTMDSDNRWVEILITNEESNKLRANINSKDSHINLRGESYPKYGSYIKLRTADEMQASTKGYVAKHQEEAMRNELKKKQDSERKLVDVWIAEHPEDYAGILQAVKEEKREMPMMTLKPDSRAVELMLTGIARHRIFQEISK